MKIILAGATGRMGQEIRQLVSQQKNLKIVGTLGRHSPIPTVKADVLLDFSQPDFIEHALKVAVNKKMCFVSGTTGIDKKQISKLKAASKKIPVLWAPNMSLGIQVVRQMLNAFSNIKDYEFSINDIHHIHKKDSPSGTALYLQKNLAASIKKVAPIHSVREGAVFGIHKITVTGPEEKITIEHEAFNRTVFARGAIICAKWIINKKKGFYSMEDVVHV